MYHNIFQINHPSKKTARRTLGLFAAMLINVALGYVAAKFNTKWLSIEEFGQFNLFINAVMLIQVFFNLGLFETASRLIAIEKTPENSQRIFGSLVIISLGLGLLLNLTILIAAQFIDSIFEIKIAFLLTLFWPLAMTFAWQNMLQIVLRGYGYIGLLSAFTFTPRLLYALSMLLMINLGAFTLTNSIAAYLLSTLAVVLIGALQLRPSFKSFKRNWQIFLSETKSFGSHLYVANVMSASIYHIDKLIVGYFLDARQLAFYALAFTLTAPIPYFSNALSTSSFKQFALQKRIGKKTLLINAIYIVCISALVILFHRLIIIDLFSEEFAPAIPSLLILVIAFAFNALSVPYTMFFKAHRRGLEVRNITVLTQFAFLLLNILLVPLLGIAGAAIASLITFLLDYLLCLIKYTKLFSDNEPV